LRLGSFGRTGFGAWMSKDDPDAESDQSGLDVLLASPIMNRLPTRRSTLSGWSVGLSGLSCRRACNLFE
jgi:hypothetical protein